MSGRIVSQCYQVPPIVTVEKGAKLLMLTYFQKLVKLSTIIFCPGSSMLSNVIGWKASCFVFEVSFVNRRL